MVQLVQSRLSRNRQADEQKIDPNLVRLRLATSQSSPPSEWNFPLQPSRCFLERSCHRLLRSFPGQYRESMESRSFWRVTATESHIFGCITKGSLPYETCKTIILLRTSEKWENLSKPDAKWHKKLTVMYTVKSTCITLLMPGSLPLQTAITFQLPSHIFHRGVVRGGPKSLYFSKCLLRACSVHEVRTEAKAAKPEGAQMVRVPFVKVKTDCSIPGFSKSKVKTIRSATVMDFSMRKNTVFFLPRRLTNPNFAIHPQRLSVQISVQLPCHPQRKPQCWIWSTRSFGSWHVHQMKTHVLWQSG